MSIQKTWDCQTGFSIANFIDLNNPILIFDSGANTFVKYADLAFEDQDMIDVAVDYFEEPFIQVVRLGSKFYEQLNYNRLPFYEKLNKSVKRGSKSMILTRCKK